MGRDSAAPPLVVDLDGTLIEGDTLWEGLAALAKADRTAFLQALLALPRGRARFKRAVASASPVTGADVKFNEAVVEFVRREAERRPVILATAADRRVADAIAGSLGCFTAVIATDGGANLKGAAKRDAILAHLRANDLGEAFDYVGDSPADRPIWAAARTAYVVAPTPGRAAALAGEGKPHVALAKTAGSARDYVKAMRPHQWAKNGLIFLPLALSQQYVDAEKVALAAVAFLAFSLCASATYIWNDILDLRDDRVHPRKKERPFARGALGVPAGLAFSAALLLVSFGAAFALLGPVVAALFAGYIIFTLTYSLYLKEKLLVDALTLGLLYGYRIVIGAAATDIVVTDWLIAFSVFFFFGLALVKRYVEIARRGGGDGVVKGRGYWRSDGDIVSMMGVTSCFVSVLIMTLYIKSPEVAVLYERPQILWLIVLVVMYWIARVWVLAHREQMAEDPVVFALKDRISILCGLICLGAILAAA